MPIKCPALICGDNCPAVTASGTASGTAGGTASGTTNSSCVRYYLYRMAQAAVSTPLPGCTDACPDGTAQCCSKAKVPTICPEDALSAGTCTDSLYENTPFSFQAYADSDGHLLDPFLTYQNFLNQVYFCIVRTCNCPGSTSPGDLNVVCSGKGQCQYWEGDGHSPADPTYWSCACQPGYSGATCALLAPGSSQLCPSGWNERSATLQPCGGLGHGTCNEATGTCECAPGWGGAACDVSICPSVNGKLCTGHGMCNLLGECLCETGYTGQACQCTTATPPVCEEQAAGTGADLPDGSSIQNMGDAATSDGSQKSFRLLVIIIASVLVITVIILVLCIPSSKAAEPGAMATPSIYTL